MSDGLERNTRTVMLLTTLSRITGLIRDGVFSRLLGTYIEKSWFDFAFLIPNAFRRLFGEGALSAAFLPTYQRVTAEDKRMAAALAGGVLGALAVGLGAIVVLGESVLFLVSAASGHEDPSLFLLMLTLPYIPLVCIVAIVGAMLHVHGKFGPTAATPLILNGCIITATLIGWKMFDTTTPNDRLAITAMAAGSVIVAGFFQVAWSLWALRGKATMLLDVRGALQPLSEVFRRAAPMILGLGVLQINTLIDGLIASWPALVDDPTVFGHEYPLNEHAMAVISYSQRLYQFPLGVFGLAVATVIYPLLTGLAGNPGRFTTTVRRGVRLVLFISIPASVGLLLVREPLTRVILQGGAFTEADTAKVSFVLIGYAASIWAYMLIQILTRAFYARDEVMTPVRIAMAMVSLNLVLNLTLIWTPLGVAGLAWSTAICAAIQAVLLIVILRKRGVAPVNREVWSTLGRILIATAIMAACVWGLSLVWPARESMFGSIVRLMGLTATGGLVILVVASAMRMHEWRWVIGHASGLDGDASTMDDH
ncbi:MAG: murein biosynthesis integral membrane protein MurJ [Planctomycetes bacterium]|jgi:putative peptidoglycan lipid II flippase|nr:murein biosynthesis integral membrane protein MurJ [Planctomycetota bacterium]MCP4838821.1 murein biosynthesis integral membrane protein MurJ [Planctomycetota bacterium]